MMQAHEMPASLYVILIRDPVSVIEFQSQLYISWRLGTGDLSHRGSQTHVRCVELHVVERVDEVASELQAESLSNREVLMQTEVDVAVMRRTQI